MIDLTQLSCACSNSGSCAFFSRNNKVDSEPPIESSDEEENGHDIVDDNDSDLYTSVFSVKGSTYDEQYQRNLKTVQSAIRHKKESVVKLLPEKDNPRDSNAICVVVQLDSAILPLGYIGVKKIPKLPKPCRTNK